MRGWGVSVTLRPLFTSGKEPVPIVQEAGWTQGRSGQVRKISPPQGFDPRTVQPVASRYTDWAIPAHKVSSSLSQRLDIKDNHPHFFLFLDVTKSEWLKMPRDNYLMNKRNGICPYLCILKDSYRKRWLFPKQYYLHAVFHENSEANLHKSGSDKKDLRAAGRRFLDGVTWCCLVHHTANTSHRQHTTPPTQHLYSLHHCISHHSANTKQF